MPGLCLTDPVYVTIKAVVLSAESHAVALDSAKQGASGGFA
jgi:hypothetical protein